MRHKIDDVTSSYFQMDIENIKESYKTAIPLLTFIEKTTPIEKQMDLKKDPEYLKLKDEVKSLSKIVQQTIEDRKKRFDELPKPRG